ncbi:uncharacterized protein LOC121367416 [Gigantopelta aegis]|uniref:uncharacterized protein LOC121367416 n=1 Tax=Gigantopelta aegis TaxID=1735272 RepID=UPI001B88A097|nr:uncharacterized protein LOC121367416 [Gigantopelta aegis]
MNRIYHLLFVLFICEITEARVKQPLGCFTCTSLNGSNPSCEDPFSPAAGTYDPDCQQGVENRVGVFPAKYCTKIKGKYKNSNLTMLVRSCGMSAMLNTCGPFEFKGKIYNGCLMSCRGTGCNQANVITAVTSPLLFLLCCLSLCLRTLAY